MLSMRRLVRAPGAFALRTLLPQTRTAGAACGSGRRALSADIPSIWKQDAALQKQKDLTFLRYAK